MKGLCRRKIKLVAENNAFAGCMDIYLERSGKREFLTTYRWNGYLFRLLKDGRTLDEVERATERVISELSLTGRRYYRGRSYSRLKNNKNRARKFENTMMRLIEDVNTYIYGNEDKNTGASAA